GHRHTDRLEPRRGGDRPRRRPAAPAGSLRPRSGAESTPGARPIVWQQTGGGHRTAGRVDRRGTHLHGGRRTSARGRRRCPPRARPPGRGGRADPPPGGPRSPQRSAAGRCAVSAPTRRRRGCAGVVLLALLCVVAAAALLRYAQHELNRPRLLAPTDFTVTPGETSRAVLDRLERQGLIGSALVARLWLGRTRGDRAIRAGECGFEGTQSAIEVLERLVRGEVVSWPVTMIEGLTFQETAPELAAAASGSEKPFPAEFTDPGRVRDLDPAADNLEG